MARNFSEQSIIVDHRPLHFNGWWGNLTRYSLSARRSGDLNDNFIGIDRIHFFDWKLNHRIVRLWNQ
jgi:hypothetical protein